MHYFFFPSIVPLFHIHGLFFINCYVDMCVCVPSCNLLSLYSVTYMHIWSWTPRLVFFRGHHAQHSLVACNSWWVAEASALAHLLLSSWLGGFICTKITLWLENYLWVISNLLHTTALKDWGLGLEKTNCVETCF